MDILSSLIDIGQQVLVVLGGLLTAVGALKLVAKHTSSDVDDKVLDAVYNAIGAVRDFVAKFIPGSGK